VPALVAPTLKGDGSITVIDSCHMVEYPEDRVPEIAALWPTDPDDRAECRFRIDHISERIVPYFYRFLGAQQPDGERDDP
jgi:glutathione S-transferase